MSETVFPTTLRAINEAVRDLATVDDLAQANETIAELARRVHRLEVIALAQARITLDTASE